MPTLVRENLDKTAIGLGWSPRRAEGEAMVQKDCMEEAAARGSSPGLTLMESAVDVPAAAAARPKEIQMVPAVLVLEGVVQAVATR